MVTKRPHLKKGMGSPVRYACYRKEMLGWIREKMGILELAPRGGRFFTSGSTTTRNNALTCNDPCVPGGDYSTVARNGSWDNAHTSDLFSRGKRLGEKLNTWCNAHNI
jgi:hypothetical protein